VYAFTVFTQVSLLFKFLATVFTGVLVVSATMFQVSAHVNHPFVAFLALFLFSMRFKVSQEYWLMNKNLPTL
jgi:hypothetical protein